MDLLCFRFGVWLLLVLVVLVLIDLWVFWGLVVALFGVLCKFRGFALVCCDCLRFIVDPLFGLVFVLVIYVGCLSFVYLFGFGVLVVRGMVRLWLVIVIVALLI